MIISEVRVLEKLTYGNFVSEIASIWVESCKKLLLNQFGKLIYEISDKTARSSTMRILKWHQDSWFWLDIKTWSKAITWATLTVIWFPRIATIIHPTTFKTTTTCDTQPPILISSLLPKYALRSETYVQSLQKSTLKVSEKYNKGMLLKPFAL